LNKTIQIKKLLIVLAFTGLSYLVLGLFSALVLPPLNQQAYSGNFFSVLSLKIPRQLNFCGEEVPTNDFNVRNKIEYEFYHDNYWKSNSLLLFNRARRWFPYIESVLKKNGIPDDFKYLAVIESHLSNVTSPASAAGFWQLLPNSARNYGLEVNDFIDERYHVEKSTEAACKHIKDAYKVFHNWTLAAAAYNLGIGGMLTVLKKQKVANYYELKLNAETGSFVYRILAYKTLLSNPKHFGIAQKKMTPLPKPNFKQFSFDSTIHSIYDLANYLKISVDAIKCLNPWVRNENIPNSTHKKYTMILPPKSGLEPLTDFISDINPVGYVKKLEQKVKMNSNIDTIQKPVLTWITYTVKVNEPIHALAKFLNVNESDLRKWNNLGDKQEVVTGQTLTILKPSH